jgi:hypothetical protein
MLGLYDTISCTYLLHLSPIISLVTGMDFMYLNQINIIDFEVAYFVLFNQFIFFY